MISRRSALVAGLLLAMTASDAGSIYSSSAGAAEVADLKDTLESGLRARLPQDFAFIGTVVTMVEGDQLPYPLVISTYQWVRKKKKFKSYLVPYFEAALRERAKKIGIQIP